MANNKTLAKISNDVEAKEAWKIFFGRFYESEPPEKVLFNPDVREFKPRKNRNAKNLPPFQKKERTDHSDDFDDFLNGNIVRIPESISLNDKELENVKKKIKDGKFTSKVFDKMDHVYYALWLFKQNEITRQQMATILAMWQIKNKKGFRILDENGNFTLDAHNILIPILKNIVFNEELSKKQLERFRLLILTAPKSEQIFYLSDPIEDIFFKSGKNQLGLALYKNNSWYRIEYQNQKKDCKRSRPLIN